MKRLLALAFLLTACGAPVSGTVEAKAYDDLDVTIVNNLVCNGKTCTPHIQTLISPERWLLQVCREPMGCLWVSVEEEVWNETEVGQFYSTGVTSEPES